MKFGPVPVGDALGAVLAHSVAIGAGRLRKGSVIGADDVLALRDAGLDHVTVARLDADDMDENAAAQAVAAALAGTCAGVRLSVAATGRVNLIATGAGIARVDAAAITAANAVDPAITVATVPPFHRMEAGGLIATIKIISYGVARSAVDRVAKCGAKSGAGALGLFAPCVARVGLIETTVDVPVTNKGADALKDRLARLGVDFAGCVLVPHDVDALAAALRHSTAPVVCVLTGSATSDILDTGPQALRAAGGRVHLFGMPVDPGNLLFLGDLDGRIVIGLPGCARSIALNGADWVLERVLCGVPVTAADVAGMGVGGLLKEIPSRPRPRRADGAA